ncbi:hypothetical protein MTR67_023748 [Solanum verrucosum]|uniref:Uncharacterized protein n=1 Tax=Solanum verrucosum TaxID=315347 RepID=A0AAF0QXT4_SOLVR|nr:hypothetical protein MTR67_023748 [Solanum verrucosum]
MLKPTPWAVRYLNMLVVEKDYFSIRLPAHLYSCGTDSAILRMEHATSPWRHYGWKAFLSDLFLKKQD